MSNWHNIRAIHYHKVLGVIAWIYATLHMLLFQGIWVAEVRSMSVTTVYVEVYAAHVVFYCMISRVHWQTMHGCELII